MLQCQRLLLTGCGVEKSQALLAVAGAGSGSCSVAPRGSYSLALPVVDCPHVHSPVAAAGVGRNPTEPQGISPQRRRTFSILERGEAIATSKVVSSLLRNITINLWGLGATIIGLQVSVQCGTKCCEMSCSETLECPRCCATSPSTCGAWVPPSSASR